MVMSRDFSFDARHQCCTCCIFIAFFSPSQWSVVTSLIMQDCHLFTFTHFSFFFQCMFCCLILQCYWFDITLFMYVSLYTQNFWSMPSNWVFLVALILILVFLIYHRRPLQCNSISLFWLIFQYYCANLSLFHSYRGSLICQNFGHTYVKDAMRIVQ